MLYLTNERCLMLADPTLAVAMFGYPLTVTSAPCYNCGVQIGLAEPEVFYIKGSLTNAAVYTLRARVATHDPVCAQVVADDIAQGALGGDAPKLHVDTSVVVSFFRNMGTVLSGPDEFNTYLVSHDEGRQRIAREDLAEIGAYALA
jgi:hypothetical protein